VSRLTLQGLAPAPAGEGWLGATLGTLWGLKGLNGRARPVRLQTPSQVPSKALLPGSGGAGVPRCFKLTSPWTDSFSHKPSGWMRQAKGSLLNEPGSHAIWVC